MTKPTNYSSLDHWFPPRGPCAICGHRDARHRLWDTIMDSPEDDRKIARDHELPIAAVQAVRQIRPYKRGKL